MTDDVAGQLPDLLATDLDDGFTELVRVHARAVHAFLFRVTGSTAEADDLGQDTFLRAYTALQGYSPQRRRELRPRAWLMTIAANVWRNHVRTSVRRPVSVMQVEDTEDSWSDMRPGPEESAETADDRGRLVVALSKLPENHRIPVVLRHVVGMSYAEVAQVQGCPVGTAKAQVSRGLSGLRRLLAPDAAALREVAM
ncbi:MULTISPECIES: RNA polymerase sigma factor [unclassified Streptomyces]|uniref:RNA polymerase sigma factor n=1 Tax=unclassified Streptomyces TaxID=2593676 RepID=UPI002DDBF23F|nr:MULTISPECIES: RNA polymerase sigma factor [unclassified Streptomyces]WSA94885.1 RNA polymerase sigma factor [Streptomyces sp. NBC_01795]WSB79305.1 RNA polymerase sigma factor [Streptomyces sp. NBC_01775]WSS12491.1 RNA polymerase sigma factor [Streptomyces sp. NBC_01186]WSS41277.1 RNA polymerase sigma factor [Streptomyces sp. NBC_01187]